ncbi:MAG: methionine--tRNA ligase subunit beta [Microgenomates group bacterium]|jgi:methionyl-tRNA synthetase
MITFDDFSKVELKVGTILEAEEIEGSDKLLKLQVDFGEEQPRQILSGIKKWYTPKSLIGKQVTFVTNLEPRMMMGLESNGMILAVGDDKPVLLKPIKKVSPGAKVK